MTSLGIGIGGYYLIDYLYNLNEFSGIKNIGKTCYMNSALQMLYQIPEIRNKQLDKKNKIYNAICSVMNKIKNKNLDCRDEIGQLQDGCNFSKFTQEDASDALAKFKLPENIVSIRTFINDNNHQNLEDIVRCNIKNISNQNHHIFCVDRSYYNIENKRLEKSSIPISFKKTLLINNENYELKSIIRHMGAILIDGGHYVAYSKGKDKNWYCCNDSTISPAGDIFNNTEIQQQAYAFLYSKINRAGTFIYRKH